MKQHIVTLTFIYDEDEYPQVTDKETAIQEAINEINRGHAWLHFDYQLSE